jgi:molybdate transport system substrate-binding protein
MFTKLVILSGGAAQGLVDALAARFKAETGCGIDATFGAVGAMRERLLAGAPADLLILTRGLIDDLARQGHAVPGSAVDIGAVATAIAVRSGDPAPAVGDAVELRTALLAAGEICVPDPAQATAGIHFAGVLDRLGIAAEVAPRLRAFPNGMTAMGALAASTGTRPIGCTQVTEIVATPGVTLVAPLPDPLGLATVYTAAVHVRAAMPGAARALADLLAGGAAQEARRRAGFTTSASR